MLEPLLSRFLLMVTATHVDGSTLSGTQRAAKTLGGGGKAAGERWVASVHRPSAYDLLPEIPAAGVTPLVRQAGQQFRII